MVPPADADALAEAIIKVVKNREHYLRERSEIAALFDINQTVARYEELFAQFIP